MTRFCLFIASVAILAGCSAPDMPRYYVTTLGADTVHVESIWRTDSTIVGVIVERTPFTYRIDYTATLGPDGWVNAIDARMTAPAAEGDAQTMSVTLENGEALLERVGGPNEGRATLEVPGHTIPTLSRVNSSVFVMEQIDRRLQSGDPIVLVGPSNSSVRDMNVRIVNGDSISLDFFGNPKYAWFTRTGQHRLLGASGAETTMKIEVRPASDPLDVDALGARWAEMDTGGAGIGTPSPRTEATASFMDADFEVVYSQPAKRGRVIWGDLVPYGEVWRTGANAATVFGTSRDLVMGDASVPAGSYSLWTIFTEDSATLILNSETGQWGTAYNDSLDFVRIPMIETPVEETERFTIRVDEMEDGGALSLGWGSKQFTVEFQPN